MEGIAQKRRIMLMDHKLGANKIDELPDSLLVSIISHLAIKDAVRTSILSHRWRHLWKWIPSIDFDSDLVLQDYTYAAHDKYYEVQSGRLATIAKHVFSSHYGTISRCRILHYLDNCQSDIVQWLNHLSKRGIHKLILDCQDGSGSTEDTWKDIQSTIIHCSSLRALVLCSWELVDATPLMGFCSLTTLVLRSVHLTNEAIMDIISKCVALEWLALLSCKKIFRVKIHAPKLKGLELRCLLHLENIDIVAPSLTTLTLSSVRVESTIKLEVPNIQIFCTAHISEGRINQIGGIIQREHKTCNENMDLLARCVSLYGGSSRNWFKNLRELVINVELTDLSHGIVIRYVLNHCIHLQVLHLEIEQYSDCDESESSSTLSRLKSQYWQKWDAIDYFYDDLKTVTMNGFKGEPLELDFVNHLITKAPGLQRIKIYSDKYCSEAHELARRRASSTLNIAIEPTRIPWHMSGRLMVDAKI